MRFDIEGARRAGWNDEDIIAHLSSQAPNFDVEGARRAGWGNRDIAQYLATGEGFSRSPHGGFGAFVRGANSGAATALGLPVDTINYAWGGAANAVEALTGAELPDWARPGEAPFGGRQSIMGGMDWLSSTANQLMGGGPVRATYDDVSQLPPEERPAAVAGEVVGGSLPYVMAPFALARIPQNAAQGGVAGALVNNPIVNSARTAPGTMLAAEMGAVGGAAQGAALAETFFPGNPWVRAGAEIGGSFANPAGTIARGAGRTGEALRNLASGFTGPGRQRRAAEYVAQAFQNTGEDPAAALSALRAADDLGVQLPRGLGGEAQSLTAGQITGSPTILAIENQLARGSSVFAANRSALAQEGLEALRNEINRSVASGDPAALARAAQMRARYFDDLMRSRLQQATEEAQSALQQMAPGGAGVRPEASQQAYSALESAIQDARTMERELWSAVPRDVPVSGAGFLRAVEEMRGRMLPDARLASEVEGMIGRVMNGQPFTSADYLNLRSDLLSRARIARSGPTPDYRMAEIYDELANGVLDDLSALPGDEAAIAREFSRNMHGAFSQTFAGQALGTSGTGGARIEPEMMLERAFGSGGTGADVRFRQLQDAAALPSGQGGNPDNAVAMALAQEDFLRGTAARAINPETGQAAASQIARLLAGNENLLSRFPNAQSDIALALSSQRALERVAARPQYATTVLGPSSPFGRLIRDSDSPVSAAQRALSEGASSYSSLANLARRGGDEAIGGLRAATMEGLMRNATGSSGNFDFARFRQALTGPTASSSTSPLDLMIRNGVISEDGVQRLYALLDRAEAIQTSMRQGREMEELVGQPDALFDLVTRMIGARIGASGPIAQGSGASLVMAGAASRTARNIFANAPRARLQEALIQLVEDPNLFALALERAPTPQARAENMQRIYAALINAGINLGDEPEHSNPREQIIDLLTNPESRIPQITIYNDSPTSSTEEELLGLLTGASAGFEPPISTSQRIAALITGAGRRAA